MDIKIIQSWNEDNARSEEMYIDGKFIESTYPMYECPEDATLERDLVSCSRISQLMKLAYNAGVSGDDFSVLIEKESEE